MIPRELLRNAAEIQLFSFADGSMPELEPMSESGRLDMLQAAGIQPNVRHRTDNFELVRSLVARGQGYSLLVQKTSIDHSYEGLPVVAKKIAPQFSREQAVIVCIQRGPPTGYSGGP